MRFLPANTLGRRAAAAAVLTVGFAGAALITAGGASAHVTVAAPGVTAGASDAVITFRVPNESDKASTVGLKVQLPTDHPIAGVLVSPMPGWTSRITQTTLSTPIKTDDGDITQIVSEIDWTADASSGIKPGYFGQFTIIGGKLPDDVTTLTFKAIQTYSDKSVVSWIEQPAPGSNAEPDHPAPSLDLSASTAAPPASATATDTDDSRANVGIALGAVGVVLGSAGLAIVVLRRRPTSSS
ncbi:YcnI family copper-binding membrane protein [Jatrophihabitans sp. DSM 45814]